MQTTWRVVFGGLCSTISCRICGFMPLDEEMRLANTQGSAGSRSAENVVLRELARPITRAKCTYS